MPELLEAKIRMSALPRVGRVVEGRASLVLRRRGSVWYLEAPLQEEVFPLARWLRAEGILDQLDGSASLALEAMPEGDVCFEVQGSREAVDRFLQWIEPEVPRELRVRHLAPAESAASILTELQEDALRRAVALGYYRIPRAIHLSDLAARIGVSPAALSERLRRAEARLVARHLARGSVVASGEAAIGAED